MNNKDMNNKDRFILHAVITALIMLFIFFQSALPADLSQGESGLIVFFLSGFFKEDPRVLSFAVRKCAHFTEYTVLGLSLRMTVQDLLRRRQGGRSAARPAYVTLLSWCAGTLYAVTDEVHQMLVPGRSCEIRDVLIDSCGVFLGAAIMHLIKKVSGERS